MFTDLVFQLLNIGLAVTLIHGMIVMRHSPLKLAKC
jgi:hypothetical protein